MPHETPNLVQDVEARLLQMAREKPSSFVSQFEGMKAGIEAEVLCLKKRLCCQPTVAGQEHEAQLAIDQLKPVLSALEAINGH